MQLLLSCAALGRQLAPRRNNKTDTGMQLLSWEAGHLNTHATCCTSPYCLAQGYLGHASAPGGLLMRPPRHSLPAALWQTGPPLSDPASYRTSESCLKGPPPTAEPLNPHTMQWAGKAVPECRTCVCVRALCGRSVQRYGQACFKEPTWICRPVTNLGAVTSVPPQFGLAGDV